MEWIKAEETKPECQKAVFVTAVSKYNGHRYTTTAMYIPPKTVLADDFLNDDAGSDGCSEYDEEKDCYWVSEGWYEYQTVPELNWLMGDTITHWMEQPIPAKD